MWYLLHLTYVHLDPQIFLYKFVSVLVQFIIGRRATMKVVVLFCVILGTLASSPEGKFFLVSCSFRFFLHFFDVLPTVSISHMFPRDFIAVIPLCFSESLFLLGQVQSVGRHSGLTLPKRIFRETRLAVLSTLIIPHMFPFAFSSCENEVPEMWKFWSFSINTGRRSSRTESG